MDQPHRSPDVTRAPRRTQGHGRLLAPALLLLVAVLGLAGCSSSSDSENFTGLEAGTRVYDQTGTSLDEGEIAELQRRLDMVQSETGADVVAVVRELDADPDETLDQAEALQQAWVAAAEIDQDTAVAILINREPGSTDEARAGIFVGSTFDDGNVPGGEQEAIVEDALIPPLRDGDVDASLTAGIDRLDTSIRNGPPATALGDFARGPGSSWLPWAGLALALLLAAAGSALSRKRPRATVAEREPTTRRPGDLEPALAAFLVGVPPQASTVSAIVLELAARDGLVIERETSQDSDEPGPVRLRLLDDTVPRSDVERAVWRALREQADGDLVDSDALGKVARSTGGIRDLVMEQARSLGWLNGRSTSARVRLSVLAVAAAALMIASIVVAAAGSPLMAIGAVAAAAAMVLGTVWASTFPILSVAGLDAARPWRSYQAGLKAAGKDRSATVDLDAVLTDVVAFNLGPAFEGRLEAATDGTAARSLRAFSPPGGSATAASFPWAVFAVTFASSSATVSAGGAGGGGGAAGST